MRIRSIQVKIALWTGLCLAVTALILIGYSVYTLRNAALRAAEQQSIAVAQAQAAAVQGQIETALNAARTMAEVLGVVKDPNASTTLNRDQVNSMLHKVLRENPQFLGTYTLWEPNAFDGKDAQYANTLLHDDTGRFIPYWVRGEDGRIHAEPIVDYETPGIGDWYLRPRSSKREVIISPFLYPILGEDVLMTSLVAPVVQNDTFYGVAGVDLRVDFLQEMINQIDLYGGQARAALITDDGKLAAASGMPDLVNQPAETLIDNYIALSPQLILGKSFATLSPDGQDLQVFVPVNFGQTGTHWSMGVLVPYAVILKEVNALVLQQVALGALLMALALALLWFLAGQIARPVRKVTEAATAVAGGDLSVTAEVRSADETGLLADAFNRMTAQLRQLVGGLEQRVAERTRALQTSSEVSRRLSTILDQAQLLQAVVDEVQSAFGYYHAQIYLYDERGEYLRMVGGTGEIGQEMLRRGHKIQHGRGLVGRAAETNQVVLVGDTRADPGWLPNPLLPETRSEAAVPIAIGDQVSGVLDVQHQQVDGLGQQDADLLLSIANQVAIAVQNTRVYDLAQREAEREAAISAIGQKIQMATSVESVLETALRELSVTLGAQRASIQVGVKPEMEQHGYVGK